VLRTPLEAKKIGGVFIMNTQQQVEKKWAFALKPLQNADTDFMISRQAIICTTESFDS